MPGDGRELNFSPLRIASHPATPALDKSFIVGQMEVDFMQQIFLIAFSKKCLMFNAIFVEQQRASDDR